MCFSIYCLVFYVSVLLEVRVVHPMFINLRLHITRILWFSWVDDSEVRVLNPMFLVVRSEYRCYTSMICSSLLRRGVGS